jgi:formate dehydrogenase iron-sulfur subunit
VGGISRRDFLKRGLGAGLAGSVIATGIEGVAQAQTAAAEPVGTIIDLTKCDGCAGKDTPLCVGACRTKNQDRFPQPAADIPLNWPQGKNEDWSDKKGLSKRLTPYNWTFVQKVKVEHEGRSVEVDVPRRCMHCDNPPCVKVCPFSAQKKEKEGPVLIDEDLCFGGAKCRDVCPWGIPARQAGVGLYMKVLPGTVGGGVMYKCDLCYDRVKGGKTPACMEACPKGALTIGPKSQMLAQAKARAAEIDGFVYGEKENGGTSTFYISPVPFEKIHKALAEQKKQQENPQAPGFPLMPLEPENYLDTPNGLALGLVAAPFAGLIAAGAAAYRTMKGESTDLGERVARTAGGREATGTALATTSAATLETDGPDPQSTGQGDGPSSEGGQG